MFLLRRNEKGQALIEAALLFPFLVLFIAGVTQFAQIAIAQQRLLMAARHGVFLLGRGQSEGTAQQKVTNFLAGGKPTMDAGLTGIDSRKGYSMPPVPVASTFQLDHVKIDYELHPTGIMRTVLGDTIPLTAECYILGGAGYFGIPVH